MQCAQEILNLKAVRVALASEVFAALSWMNVKSNCSSCMMVQKATTINVDDLQRWLVDRSTASVMKLAPKVSL